jgi:hypothetical protein
MKPPPLIAAMGARQTGKTSWIKQLLRRNPPPRLIVWDPLDQYAEFGTVFSRLDKVLWHVGCIGVGRFAAVYQPGDRLSTYEDKFSDLCAIVWGVGECLFVAEELADVTNAGWAPDGWSAITRKGGNVGKRIAAIGASQRPAEIDKTFLENATFIHCSRCNGEHAVRTMAKHLQVPELEVASLKDLEFIERDKTTGELRRGALSFG